MFLARDWEMFHTDSKKDEDRVDQIAIDVTNKRYVLDINADMMVTDGFDEEGNEIDSCYVSRFVFDLIVEGVKAKKFSKCSWKKL